MFKTKDDADRYMKFMKEHEAELVAGTISPEMEEEMKAIIGKGSHILDFYSYRDDLKDAYIGYLALKYINDLSYDEKVAHFKNLIYGVALFKHIINDLGVIGNNGIVKDEIDSVFSHVFNMVSANQKYAASAFTDGKENFKIYDVDMKKLIKALRKLSKNDPEFLKVLNCDLGRLL